ncbi:high-affinity branched-chain amino acid transport system permease [Bordetella pertussis]|nr:high-affinity branched-chain amino acid transport system permease [Bordetella pertussis]SUV94616.1 high-affinity branched-chain amino acid transport system permease [Bordetella pertussis]
MDALFFLEVTLAGLGGGALYALAALAFVIVYKATRVVNIAIGEFLMMGAYAFYAFAADMQWPVWAAIGGAILASALLGALVERVAIRPMLGESPISVFMITVGLASILVGVVELVWTADQRRLPEFMPRDPVMIGEAFVAPKVFYGFWVAVGLAALVLLVFRYWRGGVALRATAADQGAAYAMGINVPRVFSLAWAAAGAMAAVARLIVGAIGGISSSMGAFGLSVLVVVIVGRPGQRRGRAAGRSFHRPGGGLGRRLPGRRVQAAGDVRGAGGDADGAALWVVRNPRDREALIHAHRDRQADLPGRRGAVRYGHAARVVGAAAGCPGAVSLPGQCLLAVSGLSGGDPCGQLHRAEHPDRLYRAGQPGAGGFHGPGRLHGGGARGARGHAGLAEPAGRRRGGHAGRAGGGRALAARQGAVPGDRHHRRVVHRPFPVRQSAADRRHGRPAGAAGAAAGHGPGHLLQDLLADRAHHRADGAGRGQPVPYPHRPRLHRDTRSRYLGRSAGHRPAALQAAVVRPVVVLCRRGRRPVGVFLPRGHARELPADHVDLLPGRHHRRRHGLDPGRHPGRGLHDHGARVPQAGGGMAAGRRRRQCWPRPWPRRPRIW